MHEQLGDGLVLRRSTPDDIGGIGDLFADLLRNPGAEEPVPWASKWVNDLLGGSHPTVSPSDCTVVEDTATGQIVSACGFIPQVWRYGSADDGPPVEFGVGQPELVATAPEYRRRGLVRRQFEVLHRWSEERGHLVQAVNGIRNYYRQFGYEMTIDMYGGRYGGMHHIPKLGKDETEKYRVRPGTERDLPFFMEMHRQHTNRLTVSCVRDKAVWRFDLYQRELHTCCFHVIEREDGTPIGAVGQRIWETPNYSPLRIAVYELIRGISWLEVTPSVLRWIKAQCAENKAADTETDESEKVDKPYYFRLRLPRNHPVFEVIPEKLQEEQKPFAWYMRVPDLPRFLKHITPVLEQRIANSFACGHSGELKISFYRGGLRIVLENGRLAEVEQWTPTVEDQGNAFFPDLTFLHLVFGHRTLDEVHDIYVDCTAEPEPAAILRAMFPKRPSLIWQVR